MAVLVKPLRLLSLVRLRGIAVNLQIICGQPTQHDDLLLTLEAHSRKDINFIKKYYYKVARSLPLFDTLTSFRKEEEEKKNTFILILSFYTFYIIV